MAAAIWEKLNIPNKLVFEAQRFETCISQVLTSTAALTINEKRTPLKMLLQPVNFRRENHMVLQVILASESETLIVYFSYNLDANL